MQKKLIALAVAGLVSGGAFAQSNVQIYGTVDLALTSGNFGKGSVFHLMNSGYTTERLGFQGSEDLGGGMKANFRLEMGQGTDNGSNDSTVGQFFQRESRLGLSGGFGSLDAGRQYSPLFNLQAGNELFRVAGVSSNYTLINTGMTRVSNSVRWQSADMSGFGVTFMYGLGDTGSGNTKQESNVDPKDAGRHTGLNLRYANGPLSLGYAYANQKAQVTVGIPSTTKVNFLGGSYNFKVFKVVAEWQKLTNSATALADTKYWSLGASVPVGTDEFKIAYTSKDLSNVGASSSKLFAVGYVHPMSKRTTLFANASKMTNDSKATASMLGTAFTGAAGYDPSAFQLGVSHNF